MGKGREFTFKEKLEITFQYESLLVSWMKTNWFTTMQAKGATIFEDLLVVVAHQFYTLQPRDTNDRKHQLSHGWVTKLKKKSNIKAYARHGEDASADTSAKVLRRMEKIKTIKSKYDSDEAGFFLHVRAVLNVG